MSKTKPQIRKLSPIEIILACVLFWATTYLTHQTAIGT